MASRSVERQSSARALTGCDRGCSNEGFGRLVQGLEDGGWGDTSGKTTDPGAPCTELVGVITVGVVTVQVFIISGTGMLTMGTAVATPGHRGSEGRLLMPPGCTVGGAVPGGPLKGRGAGGSLLWGCRATIYSSSQSFRAAFRA